MRLVRQGFAQIAIALCLAVAVVFGIMAMLYPTPAQIVTTIVVREGTTSVWRVCYEDEDQAAVTPDNAWRKIQTLGGNTLLEKTAITGLATCNDIVVDALDIPTGEIDPTASTPQNIVAFLVLEYNWAGGTMESAQTQPFSLQRVVGYPL